MGESEYSSVLEEGALIYSNGKLYIVTHLESQDSSHDCENTESGEEETFTFDPVSQNYEQAVLHTDSESQGYESAIPRSDRAVPRSDSELEGHESAILRSDSESQSVSELQTVRCSDKAIPRSDESQNFNRAIMYSDSSRQLGLLMINGVAPPAECVLYVCGRCGCQTDSAEGCRRHMLRHHPPPPPLTPPAPAIKSCTHEYWLQPRTPREVRSRLCADWRARCSVRRCSLRFASEADAILHARCHAAGAFRCALCGAAFAAWRACSLHLLGAHARSLDALRCPRCAHRAVGAARLARHLASHLAPDRARWYARKRCPACVNTYANSKSLKKHIQAVHHKLKPFKCNVCGHSSATKNMLLLHTRQHTGEKPYACDFCPYRSGDINTRNKHRMRHTGEFPYRCEECPYRSIQSGALRSHVKKHHPHLSAAGPT